MRQLVTTFTELEAVGLASGTATYFRMYDADGTSHYQCATSAGMLDRDSIVVDSVVKLLSIRSEPGMLHSIESRNCQIDAAVATIGAHPLLRLYGGGLPADIANPPGNLISELQLPEVWMHPAQDGRARKRGSWEDASARGSGVQSHLRFCRADGEDCIQRAFTWPTSVLPLGEPVPLGSPIRFEDFEMSCP